MTRYIFLFLLSTVAFICSAQKTMPLTGKVFDSGTKQSVPGATVVLTNQKDSLDKRGTVTDSKGNFSIKLKSGAYELSISFIGYKEIQKTVHINNEALDLGHFYLIEAPKMLSEINVVEIVPPTLQKGDTTVFNPEAFKVNPDATAEELILKMPGFYSIEGKLTAQGQTIKEVLVDGKKFFGNDVNGALETLPSDIIKNVEVYDYESDEAKFSGFKDKEKSKTVNVVTKTKSDKMRFGSLAGGVGGNEKYAMKGEFNQFSEKTRYTLTGNSKNVNAPLHLRNNRFSRGAISGDEMQENSFAANFNTKDKKENELSASYRYASNEIKLETRSLRTYTSYPLEGQKLSDENISNNEQSEHGFNFHWDIQSNPKNKIMINSSLSASDSKSKTTSFSETKLVDEFINSSHNLSAQADDYIVFNQTIMFSRMLNKTGRTISTQASYSRNDRKANGDQKSEIKGQSELGSQNIDQISSRKTNSENIRAALSFNEKLSKKSRLSLSYNYAFSTDETRKVSYNYEVESESYSKLDSLTSNRFKNARENNTARIAYDYQVEKFSFMLGNDFEFTKLKNEEAFPNNRELKKTYFSILPSANVSYYMSQNSTFNIYYNMRTSNPSIQQLQEIVNVSNPLFLSIGNSSLKQSQNHNVMLFYTLSNMERNSFTSVNISLNKTDNTVSQKTIVAANDTLINGKYMLPKGGQFSQPINLNGQYNASGRITYSMPVKSLSSKLNIKVSALYSRIPTWVNDQKSFSNSLRLDQGFKLSSNISEKFDFTISSQTQYSVSNNTNLKSTGSKYLSQKNSMSVYWNFLRHFILKTNTNFVSNNNITNSSVETSWLLDIGLSSKVFKNKRGEISLVAYDILNQTNERFHRVNDLYTTDSYSKTLNRFYMLSFTYKIRNANRSQEKHAQIELN